MTTPSMTTGVTRTLARGVIAATIAAAAFAGTAAAQTAPQTAAALPSYKVDAAQTTVSGLSSGGFMAIQFHVAYSASVAGAGVVAGGPYYCAQGSSSNTYYPCMYGSPSAAPLYDKARSFASQKLIDPLSGLAGDKVYIFTGKSDHVVSAASVEAARQFYKLAGVPDANIQFVNNVDAGHVFVTTSYGNACSQTQAPFINDCDYDQAGAILQQLYGTLNPPSTHPAGKVVAFNQAEFIPKATTTATANTTVSWPTGWVLPNFWIPSTLPIVMPSPLPGTGSSGGTAALHSMNPTGYVYVPDSCAKGETCRIHVAYHGCKQTVNDVGDTYYTKTGYNRWADTNKIIVLYPQVIASSGNQNGCWDWFGYDSANYAFKTGPQMVATKAMVDRLAGVKKAK